MARWRALFGKSAGLANHETPIENKTLVKFNFVDAVVSLVKALCETLLGLAFFFPGRRS